MILPIGDTPNERSVPVVTYLLIAVNVAVYFLVTVPLGAERPDPSNPLVAEYVRTMTGALGGRVSASELLENLSTYDLFVFTHAFRPVAPTLSGLFLSMFLHGGLVHLVGNMLFLWIYGDNVEQRLGRLRYLVAYLGTGIAATLFHWASDRSSAIPVVGASGAIAGILGLYFVWFPRNRVRLLALFPPFLMNVFEVPSRLVLGLFLIADNLLPYLMDRSPSGVAHGAHIGGFVAGVAAAWLLDRYQLIARPPEYRHGAAPGPGDASGLGRAIADGRFADAAETYFASPAHAVRGALSPRDAVPLAHWLRENGHVDASVRALLRALHDHPTGSGAGDAHALAGTILTDDLAQPALGFQHFRRALDVGVDAAGEAAARRGLAEIAARQKRNIGHPYRARA